MKTLKNSLLVLAGFGAVLLVTPAPAAASDEAGLSPATLEKLRSTLPHYPRQASAPSEPVTAAPATVFHLPNIVFSPPATAQAGILRRMAEDSLYQRGAFDRELVQRELSVFDRCFLNRFTLPLFSVSKETRARQAYLERKSGEFHDEANAFAGIVQLSDPKEAAALRACLRQWQ